MNNQRDFKLARDEHWYRIPVEMAHKWGKHHWPPRWLAFYQAQVFGEEAFSVRYFAHVHEVRTVQRRQLFPNEANDRKAESWYYQMILSPLQMLPRPIISRRFRRVTFIPTTWQKFWVAEEINDLWDDSPLEDHLWTELKQLQLSAERQHFITLKRRRYALDFAFYHANGRLNVETDGDRWHSDPRRIAADNRRDNALEMEGWRLLRFNTSQIQEEMADYCLPTILDVLGGLGDPE
jgi:very-short-patch-repair endonuclease